MLEADGLIPAPVLAEVVKFAKLQPLSPPAGAEPRYGPSGQTGRPTSERIPACPEAGLPTVPSHATFEPVRLTIRHAADQEAVDSISRMRLSDIF